MSTLSANDLKLTEEFIEKMSDSPEQAEAVKKVLGVTDRAEMVANEYTPDRPTYIHESTIDHIGRADEVIEFYQDWVDSYPDDDPTPLEERQRVLDKAKKNKIRLEKINVGI